AARPDLRAGDVWLLDNARNIPRALMNGASAGWDMACRTLGECRFGGRIDREIGDMVIPESDPATAPNWTGAKQFAYVRYDPDVSHDGLIDLGLDGMDSKNVQAMDSVAYTDQIRRVGSTFAEKFVR